MSTFEKHLSGCKKIFLAIQCNLYFKMELKIHLKFSLQKDELLHVSKNIYFTFTSRFFVSLQEETVT